MIPEQAKFKRARDAGIRWRMLQTLHDSRGNQHGGWVTARYIVQIVNGFLPVQDHVESDEHALQLLRDLLNKGFALEEDNREDDTKPFGLAYLTFKATAAGSAFCDRALPPDPWIADGRIVK